VFRQERRPRLRLLEVFEDGERLEERRAAIVEHQRWHDRLRIHGDVVLIVLLALKQVDRDLVDGEPLQRERNLYAICGERTPKTIELHRTSSSKRRIERSGLRHVNPISRSYCDT